MKRPVVSIGIFYSTSAGRTRRVAESMKALIDPTPIVRNIVDVEPTSLLDHDLLILGSPTYGQGEVHYPWQVFLPALNGLDLRGRVVALFALGDGRHHGQTFAGGLRQLHGGVEGLGATIVGCWPALGYKYAASPSVRPDGTFPGLVIDEVGQRTLTDERLRLWVAQVLREAREETT